MRFELRTSVIGHLQATIIDTLSVKVLNINVKLFLIFSRAFVIGGQVSDNSDIKMI